jgi:hypothetical protein
MMAMAIFVKHIRSVALIVGVMGVSLGGCKSDLGAKFAGEKVTMEQVPDPVKQVITQQSQGGTVSEIKKKAKGGKRFITHPSLAEMRKGDW